MSLEPKCQCVEWTREGCSGCCGGDESGDGGGDSGGGDAGSAGTVFGGVGGTAQRYVTEMGAPSYGTSVNNSSTQAIAVFNGDLYRSQDGKTAFNKYSFYNNVQLSRYPLGKERSRSSINYISNANAEAPEKTWVLLGCGHGDGFAFTERDGVPYFYAHASAPEYLGDISAPISDGSSDADIELNAQINDGAAGVIRIPWSELEDAETSKSSPYVPSVENGCVWYRYLPRVTNGNFGLSTDGKWMLFVDRVITEDAVGLDRHTYTLTVTVFRLDDVEAVPAGADGVADCSGVRPYSVFSLPLPDEEDTEYAESGITSDGVNVYLTFCGARIVSRCLIEVWTLEGQHVASVTTGTIRDESPNVFKFGVDAGDGATRYFPFRYECEGLSFSGGRLLTSSRYLLAKTAAEDSAKALCKWHGETFVWSNAYSLSIVSGVLTLSDGSTLAAVPSPSNIAYWSPTSFPGGDGWTIPDYEASPTGADRLLFKRGSTVFHHYVTAFQQVEGTAEEWGLDTDVFEWPALRFELNPVATRRELVWLYNALNSHKGFPIMMADKNGGFYVFNAMDFLNGLAQMYGAKVWVDGNTVSFGTTSGRSQYSVTFDEGAGRVNIYANGGAILSMANSALVTRGNLYPATHDAYTLGRENNAWSNVFTKALSVDGQNAFPQFSATPVYDVTLAEDTITTQGAPYTITAEQMGGAYTHLAIYLKATAGNAVAPISVIATYGDVTNVATITNGIHTSARNTIVYVMNFYGQSRITYANGGAGNASLSQYVSAPSPTFIGTRTISAFTMYVSDTVPIPAGTRITIYAAS